MLINHWRIRCAKIESLKNEIECLQGKYDDSLKLPQGYFVTPRIYTEAFHNSWACTLSIVAASASAHGTLEESWRLREILLCRDMPWVLRFWYLIGTALSRSGHWEEHFQVYSPQTLRAVGTTCILWVRKEESWPSTAALLPAWEVTLSLVQPWGTVSNPRLSFWVVQAC